MTKPSNKKLRVPCCYQGGKQRIAEQIVDVLLNAAPRSGEGAMYYDLCCGSGAITIELINRGVSPENITMLDKSPWGKFWSAIGSGNFDLDAFHFYISQIPEDKKKVKAHAMELARIESDKDEVYIYPILQACSFGGKQIWKSGERWQNAFFRDYWEPTETSVRRSPANPMQPSPLTLYKRVEGLVHCCRGITCLTCDIMDFAEREVDADSIVYVDPPYRGTTSYGFSFDVLDFVKTFLAHNQLNIFVSEGVPLCEESKRLSFGGAKGGISGNRPSKHEEWLSVFGPANQRIPMSLESLFPPL